MVKLMRKTTLQSTVNRTIDGVTYYKNRINIPSEFLEELGWEKGDELQISITRNHNKIIIEKI
ncbi:AbrB/MazE/SpoVT family DNA-binding domain-containing protein [Nitrosopumilus sp.]|uniref:AbrB/MazE/SpoVT family DNA-binding domain-containing protein n=1 Tax=Nitrosopumilus sp. TaxID=2024843 RepID=UPI00292E845D|nr:AbrB/MazE/SpoVT family DNA-binding domain-containing protein [Nitrosopumilus sp.]